MDRTQYANAVVADLQVMVKALEDMDNLVTYIQGQSSLSAADQKTILGRFKQDNDAIQGAYDREEARDYPPDLKDVDDNYAETIRYASRFADTFLKILQTGDESLLPQLQDNANKFEFFVRQLEAIVNSHSG